MIDRPKSGRRKKLSHADDHFLKVTALRDRRKVSRELTQDLRHATGKIVHLSTVRRSLKRSGLRGCVAVKKPLLRRGNKAKRLKYANDMNTGPVMIGNMYYAPMSRNSNYLGRTEDDM